MWFPHIAIDLLFVLDMVILYFFAIRFRWYAIVCRSSSDVAIKIWSSAYNIVFTNSCFSCYGFGDSLSFWQKVYILSLCIPFVEILHSKRVTIYNCGSWKLKLSVTIVNFLIIASCWKLQWHSFDVFSVSHIAQWFLGAFEKLRNRLLASPCLSVHLHGTTRLPLAAFSWNLIFVYFSKISQEN